MDNKEITAKLSNIRMSPQKLRLVVNLVKEMTVPQALAQLQYLDKKGATYVRKTIESAAANAKDKYNEPKKNLKIQEMFVTESFTYKRGKAVSRGRYFSILRRGSNLFVKLTSI